MNDRMESVVDLEKLVQDVLGNVGEKDHSKFRSIADEMIRIAPLAHLLRNDIDDDYKKEADKVLFEISDYLPSDLIIDDIHYPKALRKLYTHIKKDGPLLLLGPTGTGKEAVAKLIHEKSPRKNQPFISINCAELSREFAQSTLFGHTKGSFTGATTETKGYVETAGEGTLFLDELNHLEKKVQGMLLRFIESKEYKKFGEDTYTQDGVADHNKNFRKSNCRLIFASSNTYLELRQGTVYTEKVHQDLLMRIKGIQVVLPGINMIDKKAYINAFVIEMLIREIFKKKPSAELMEKYKRNKFSFMTQKPFLEHCRKWNYFETWTKCDWPGNMRELKQHIECCLAENDWSMPPDSTALPKKEANIQHKVDLDKSTAPELVEGKFPSFEENEKEYYSKLLKHTNWDISDAEHISGIHNSTIRRKVKEYGIKKG